MRVLWFTNVPLNSLQEHAGRPVAGTGFWMHALVDRLGENKAISRLGVVYAGSDVVDDYVVLNGVDYYTVCQSRWANRFGVAAHRDELRCLSRFRTIIGKFQPDVLHVHGTERFYGRLGADQLNRVPMIVSVQGLMGPCAQVAWGDKTFGDMFRLVNAWELTRLCPTLRLRRWFRKVHHRERQILRNAKAILGRTDWDRAYCRAIAPLVPYYHVDEIMRPEFYAPRWSLSAASRHCIYTSGRMTFQKGVHTFLEALALLKADYPTLRARIAGHLTASPECRYLQRQVRRLGLSDSVEFLGWIAGPRIVQELLAAHCFVSASFVENGCNALQEAMLLGCPCVTTFAGGMTTTLQHGETGLLVERGSAHMFADAIRELFENDALCASLGTAARTVARARHEPQRVVTQLVTAYRAVVERAGLRPTFTI